MNFINADLATSARAVISFRTEHLQVSLKQLNQLRDRLRFHVLIGATMKNTVFLHVTSCSLVYIDDEKEIAASMSHHEEGANSFLRTDGKFIQQCKRQTPEDTGSLFYFKIQNSIRKVCGLLCNK